MIDRRWATVGSSNIDPFSLLLAREANVVIEDPGFAEQLRQSLLREMEEGATQLQRERWARQPLPLRAATWVSYGLARFLTGVFAYGRKEEFASVPAPAPAVTGTAPGIAVGPRRRRRRRAGGPRRAGRAAGAP